VAAFRPQLITLQDSDSSQKAPSSTFCLALSGNGGNWASTLSFISEALLSYVETLRDNAAKINLRCVVGGSSGAATTVLMRNLLANPNFGVSSDGLATPSQARSVGRALAFLAQTADLGSYHDKRGYGSRYHDGIAHDRKDFARTLKHVAKVKHQDWGEGAWDKASFAVDVQNILYQFGRSILMARTMQPSFAEREVQDLITDRCAGRDTECGKDDLQRIAKDAGVLHVADLPVIETGTKDEKKEQQLEWIMEDIAMNTIKFFDRTLERDGYTGFRHDQKNGIDVVHPPNQVDKALMEKPEEGFMTVTFVYPRTSIDQSVKDVTYEDARVLALMSRSTAEAILRSETYKSRVKACLKGDATNCLHADKYIIATVDSLRPMITLPTMEPGMVKPFVAPLSRMGVTSVFDPTKTFPLEFRLEPFDFGELESGGKEKTNSVHDSITLILGGFVDRGHSVQLQEFYAEGSHMTNVQYALFGKNTDPGTAVRAVKDLLSSEDSPELKDEHWKDYVEWASERPKDAIDVYIDWDCGAGLPANLRGASWKLRLHGAARTREVTKELFGDRTPGQEYLDLMRGCESGMMVMEAVEPSESGE